VRTVDERGEDENKDRIERNKRRFRVSLTRDGSLTRFGVEKSKGREEEEERARRVSSQESEALLNSELNCSELQTFVVFKYTYRR
jgi:hypothetical protein